MIKDLFKDKIVIFIIILIIVIAAGIGLSYGWDKYKIWKTEKDWEEWERQVMQPYYEDTYGGDTPEETWEMFLDALRKEDLDLAAKYFVIEKQAEWRENLYQIKAAGYLEVMIEDLGVNFLQKISVNDEGIAYYNIVRENEKLIATVIFYKNVNNKWKIDSV